MHVQAALPTPKHLELVLHCFAIIHAKTNAQVLGMSARSYIKYCGSNSVLRVLCQIGLMCLLVQIYTSLGVYFYAHKVRGINVTFNLASYDIYTL